MLRTALVILFLLLTESAEVNADDNCDQLRCALSDTCGTLTMDSFSFCSLFDRLQGVEDLSLCSPEMQDELCMLHTIAERICRRQEVRVGRDCDPELMDLVNFSIRFASRLQETEFRKEVLGFVANIISYASGEPEINRDEIQYYSGLVFYLMALSERQGGDSATLRLMGRFH